MKYFLPVYLFGTLLFSTGIANAAGPEDPWLRVKSKIAAVKAVWKSPAENIVNNKLSTGMLLGNGDIGVVAGDTFNRQKFYFGKSDFWGAAVKNPSGGNAVWQESILSLGGLTLTAEEPAEGGAPQHVYLMEQDIVNAEVRTTMQLGGAVVNMVSWTTDADTKGTRNIFITELTSDKDVTLHAELWVPVTYTRGGQALDCAGIYPYASGVTNNLLWTTRENYNNDESDHSGNYKVRVATALKLLGTVFEKNATGKGSAAGSFRLQAGKRVYIAVSFASGKAIGTAACPTASQLRDVALVGADVLSTTSIAALKNSHRNWWKNYWMKSYVDLFDDTFNKFYYGSLYMLGCASREGNFPPSLFGNWITTDLSSWGGRYFLNYNEQAAFYGAYSANRPELAKGYIDLILNEMPWQRNRTHAAGYEGVCHQRSLTPYHLVSAKPAELPVNPVKDYKKLPTDQKSNGMFVAMPLIWYYEYTQDTDYLKNKLYPYLKELDAFYRSYVNKDKKPYIIEHSSAHEGSDDINPNLDIGFIRRLCNLLISSSKLLHTDAQLVPLWQDMLDNLSDYPTVVRNGKTVYAESATKNGLTDIEKLFHAGDQPVNLEGAVFPGENIYLGGDKAQLALAKESLDQLGGWCVNSGGSEHNGFPKHWPVAARIGWPAEDLYTRFKAAIAFHWRASNLTAFQGGGGIETAGAIEGINSMLMQSEGGIIRLFPVWPLSKDASFVNLRAKGAFLISGELHKGAVSGVKLLSENGGACKLKNPWPGKTVQLLRNGKKSGTLSGETLTFNTVKGEALELY